MNPEINCVVFDLDGTLVNSHQTIYKAASKALGTLGYQHNLDETKFIGQIGKHFNDIFAELNFFVDDMNNFIQTYKEHYFEFIEYSELYPDVNDVLEFIKEKNLNIGLLTTKGQDQADKIIKYFKLEKYFDIIVGRRDGLKHKPSADPLIFIKDALKLQMENILMVGDTEMDIQCGKNAGSQTCAVTFGYRSKAELELESPDFLITELSQLKNII